jgi:expansin (peptidoglycan-binding protein)
MVSDIRAYQMNALPGLYLAALVYPLAAETLEIRPTPILDVLLPNSTAWQIESSSGGGPWTATGVVASGAGQPATLRLDGYPASARYRFARIGAVAATVTPVKSTGYHLAGSAAGIAELGVETSPDLATWSHGGTVFPNATGQYIKRIPAPLADARFHRTRVPLIDSGLASIASYTADPAASVAGFGPVSSEMPALYQNGYIAAATAPIYNRDGKTASGAGECYELSGPGGTTTVIVGDYNESASPGSEGPGRSYFDVGTPAFDEAIGKPTGTGVTRCRVVPAPVTGNVKLLVVSNVSNFHLALRPYNHRAGITKLEIKSNGSSTWNELPRSISNTFEHTGSALAFPLSVRMTSRFGEVLSFPPVAAMATGDKIALGAQFETFPTGLPLEPRLPLDVYADGFSTIPGDTWSTFTTGSITLNPAYTGSAYQGSQSLRVSNISGYSFVGFNSPAHFDTPTQGYLEFAIRTETGSTNALTVVFTGSYGNLSPYNSQVIALPTISTTWRVIRVLLGTPDLQSGLLGFRIMGNGSGAVPVINVDSISFRQP